MARPRQSTRLHSLAATLVTCTLLLACTPTRDALPVASTTPPAAERWCDHLPRAGNAALPRVRVATDWFEVYRVETGVFALVESRQFQEAISYLIVGERGALLFDTGLGVVPIRPVVEELTSLPVRVLNSHTHYDHVGGNVEFGDILARDTPYTRANQRGFPHEELAGEVAAESFCGAPPPALDTAMFYTRPWKATRTVADGDTIDLGRARPSGHGGTRTYAGCGGIARQRARAALDGRHVLRRSRLALRSRDRSRRVRAIDRQIDAACPVAHASASGAQHRDS